MSSLLKIVQGPNAGAEIALVEGVAVTLGRGDDCDIVLADATLPEEPLTIETGADGAVTAGGERLERFHVKTVGATSFAIGPAEGAWQALVWPKTAAEEAPPPAADIPEAGAGVSGETGDGDAPGRDGRGGHSWGCAAGCLVAIVPLLIVAAIAWLMRDSLRQGAGRVRGWFGGGGADGAEICRMSECSIEEFAARHGLALGTNGIGRISLSGDFATRAERLAATAGAYAIRPGVAIDFCDDETLRGAVEDTLFTFGGNALKVLAATNRCAVLGGAAPSRDVLRRVLEALNADVPKLRAVDCAAVSLGGPGSDGKPVAQSPGDAEKTPDKHAKPRRPAAPLPVCGILMKPYPCLVMRNGARVLEGAVVGGSTILKIEPDTITITNSTGRFAWKP